MKAAPIHLQQLSFRRVNVELDGARQEAGEFDQLDRHFPFDGVPIATEVGIAELEGVESSARSFLLTLRVLINNKPPEDGSEWKPSPYLIDIEAGGVIRVAPGAEAMEKIEDIVLVNGASMLWSAIREQVSNLTARMPLGPTILPTVHFQDLRQPRTEVPVAEKKRSRARVSKSPSKSAT